jgi:hypothetical protein
VYSKLFKVNLLIYLACPMMGILTVQLGFWRFVRGECLYSKYYEKFPDFKQAIDNCIRNAHIEHKDELETLLSWNFQSFKNVKISTI